MGDGRVGGKGRKEAVLAVNLCVVRRMVRASAAPGARVHNFSVMCSHFLIAFVRTLIAITDRDQ